ncbi:MULTISPECIES: Hsp33 family molecular chaperone [Rhizobium/Agrobacterium group]|jgi:molecular chaperone Hsp33|uniref:Hsp33 family molecular chaperone n=1 Tax=Rhizobium/Agrobacterium group TaxID=227290 RepID=UPI0008A7C1AF|nr:MULTISPECIES: Hsp33 family molecular chaperone [Rhizobium/Agrobacterium group]MBD8652573.1 Hsp33 family molecular chaperone [Rhizobium sp. CFBP 13726]MBD8664850.1 Hsp33 family molecular chaperone [Rhizobium sp. CFBP 8752]MBP2463328.1 molecular chaperone Hsp33 [Rhizobium sp. PvP014]MBP2530723.1 molecular chaperone Hsp33 [Rhizobium sp. PvP099]NSY16094.1 Hsp33 family molecular chaperone [Neorhizobium sp. AL 9.2.2]
MAEATVELNELDFAGDDRVVPFQVDGLDVRGRAVQLGPLLNAILGRHDYPAPVARLLAEAVVLTALLGTSLKFEGKFTMQTKGDGPVDLLVADFSTPDALRAYARYDEDALAEAVENGKISPAELLGHGFLALTIDQGRGMQPYQGIVPMDGSSLEEMAGVYFRQSEQIPTRVRLAVAELIDRDEDGNPRHNWRAGGLVAQFLPQAPERMRQPDLHGGDGDERDAVEVEDDAWLEASTLVGTIDTDELTDPQVAIERLLFRLFHERGVRVYDPQTVFDRCSCSRDKIKGVLDGFSAEEIHASVEDGEIAVTCEFCSTTYKFVTEEFESA